MVEKSEKERKDPRGKRIEDLKKKEEFRFWVHLQGSWEKEVSACPDPGRKGPGAAPKLLPKPPLHGCFTAANSPNLKCRMPVTCFQFPIMLCSKTQDQSSPLQITLGLHIEPDNWELIA